MPTKAAKRQTLETIADTPHKNPLSREDWIDAARHLLEAKGIASVKVDHLARQLGVTRGSFYFHFRDRKDLLDGLVQDWRGRNCAPFDALAGDANVKGLDLHEAITDLWLENAFRPKLDLAMRDWGRVSKSIAREVHNADAARIDLLVRAMRDIGYGDEEALVRARISYLHQIGYYSVDFSEPRAARLRYVPLYLKVLTGMEGWRDRSTPARRPGKIAGR